MKALVQRVLRARVTVGDEEVAAVGPGLLILLGVVRGDCRRDVDVTASKCAHLRIMRDTDGKMNRSVLDTGGEALVVSQFTLAGDARRGRRPSFVAASPPEEAASVFDEFVRALESLGVPTRTGIFRAEMRVESINDGPVTIWFDSREPA